MVSAADVLNELAAHLREIYPSADIAVSDHPRWTQVVTLKDHSVILTLFVTPFPKVRPSTYRLSISAHPSGYWSGARWPWRWGSIIDGIDHLLIHHAVKAEAERVVVARRLAYAQTLQALQDKLGKRGRVYLTVGAKGEPTYRLVRVCKSAQELDKFWKSLDPKHQRSSRFTTVITLNGLSKAAVDACLSW